jgi:DNA primase
VNDTSILHRLDRSALPSADQFFRENVPLYRRFGSRARGRCPLHSSSSRGRSYSRPFSVDLSRGVWYCFRCNQGGDIIKFVMLRDGVGFAEAARSLGALRPTDPEEAQRYRREREVKQSRQRAHDDEYITVLRVLLREMELYESIRDRAFRTREDRLLELAEEAIIACGGDFVLLKAGALV